MPSFNSKEIVDKIIAGNGHYDTDPQALEVCQYQTPEGGTAYHVAYTERDRFNLRTSPFVHNINVLWERDENEVKMCEHCEEHPATHTQHGYDSCPTDRGEKRDYYSREVCDECDPNWR